MGAVRSLYLEVKLELKFDLFVAITNGWVQEGGDEGGGGSGLGRG